MNQCPQAHKYSIGAVLNFSKIHGDICELMFITGVNDTGEKLFSGVNDTGEKFIAGVIDTGEKFIVYNGDQLSAVTTTPAINLSPVTRTRTPWSWGG